MQRRSVLLSAAALAAMAEGATAFAITREPTRAPWRDLPTGNGDPRLFAFGRAILAPNPHNRQPWLIELVGRDEATLFCDLARQLPATDPFDRKITIGFGCFIETAVIAAAEAGFKLEVTAFPKGASQPRLDRRPIAALRFVPAATPMRDPLFRAIAERRTIKEPFDLKRALPADAIERLGRAAGSAVRSGGATDAGHIATLRDLAWKAFDLEVRTPHTYKESVDLMRIGWREIEANPDGIDLDGPLMELLHLLGQLSREKNGDPQAAAFQQGLDKYRSIFAASPGFFWIATSGNSREDQLAVGRAYLRATLEATSRGLAMHPLSQALQEFPEMAALALAMNRAVGVADDERLQMLARIGYGPSVAPSPRWPLDTRLKQS